MLYTEQPPRFLLLFPRLYKRTAIEGGGGAEGQGRRGGGREEGGREEGQVAGKKVAKKVAKSVGCSQKAKVDRRRLGFSDRR